jgi:pimeloyl-ACP methyl ester carboxylesterase
MGAMVFIAVIVLAVLIVPLLIPIPPLKNTRPPEALADPDSLFATVNGVRLHYKTAGQGKPVFVLLHGFASSLYSWREVMAPLAELGTVIAFDRPAFGLTERPLPGQWSGKNPYSLDAQVDLTLGLMDQLGVDRAILVGNSAGGAVAVKTALDHPERVQALALVSPAISGAGAPGLVSRLLRIPQIAHFGPLITRRFASAGEAFGRSAWHDPSKLTPAIWDGYKKPLQADNWDIGLWEFTKASRAENLEIRWPSLTQPVLVITGDDDRVVPTERTVHLAGELPGATLVVVPDTGHVTHEESPAAFMQAIKAFLPTTR